MENQQTLLLPLAILLFTLSTWFVLHYSKRNTSFFIIVLSIASFGLGSAAVALLPIDLSYASSASNTDEVTSDGADVDGGEEGDASTTANDNSDDPNTANPTYIPWYVTYWTTFCLAWFILPITRESLLSGYFTLRQRVKDGIKRSFRSLFVMFCAGVICIIGMAIHLKSFHLVTTVLPVLMALGNTYGLLLVSLLLGNGLVNIPKKFWREACPAKELRRARIMACGAEEELFDSVCGLEDVEDKIEEVCQTAVSLRQRHEGDACMENEEGDVALGDGRRRGLRRATWCGCCRKSTEVSEFHECLEELVRQKNETANVGSERRTRRGSSRRRAGTSDNDENDNNGGEINMMDIKYLVTLNQQLSKAQERVTSAQLRWNHLVTHSQLFSALMDGDIIQRTGSNDEVDGSTNTNLLASSVPRCLCLRRIWVRYLRFPAYRCISVITAVLSVFVLVSEVTLAASLNLSPFSWTLRALDAYHYQNTTTQILFQISALIPLLYMSLCVYTCLFQMSLLGPYCLRGNKQSNGVALVFNAQYLVRLQFPLGYNYLLMLKYDGIEHCAFNNIMSDMATIPFFGASFSLYAPIIILAVCLFTLCDVYPKLMRLLGIQHEDALLLGDDEELEGKVNEGIQLMKRDAKRRGSADVAPVSPEKQSLRTTNIIV